ncbi:uncharacterized protein HKW66_Vig0109250 [Vigna angularis]|uniref:Uncharacterized protein n=1 Tax=Phaseolus angularis TaxID=3914 RepID=A0A8T0L0L7_PHAAN|nr:uncharacterized protein HKW66_Vig0109250 [Vigna angularis]
MYNGWLPARLEEIRGGASDKVREAMMAKRWKQPPSSTSVILLTLKRLRKEEEAAGVWWLHAESKEKKAYGFATKKTKWE